MDGLTKAARVLAVAVLAQLVLLVASGVYLYFSYRPSSGALAVDLLAPDVRRAVRIREVHVLETRLLLGSCLALLVLLVARTPRTALDVVAGGWQLVMAAVASFTGLLLPWDQLALRAVTVGTNIRGFTSIVAGDQIRFVLISGSEVSTQAVVRWLIVHVVSAIALAVGPVTALVRMRRSRATRP